jgi:hypothetical protein
MPAKRWSPTARNACTPVAPAMYDVRVTTAAGELVAEFRCHTRTIRSKAEG